MIEYELRGMDLGEVRFAISPMNEVALSLRTFRDPGRYPLHLRWLQTTQADRDQLDLEVLLALTNQRFWTPDFLHPRPFSPLTSFEDELRLVAATPAREVRRRIEEIHPDGPPSVLQGRGDRVLGRIVAAVADYWESCFLPWWPRMRAVLEADVVHRGRMMSRHGMAAMFADLSERVSLVDEVVQVRTRSPGLRYRRSTAGVGLALVPSLFSRGGSPPVTPEVPPQILYAARGVGTLWEAEQRTPPAALAGLIGRPRARLLELLESPASSTELAGRLGVTPTAVNQHLRALRAAGLLTSARHGRSVLYLRSDLGDQLVDAG